MATLQCRVQAGEVLKLFPWARVEPFVRHPGVPPGTPVQSATANGSGIATFTGVSSRIEYAASRPDGRLIKLMDSTTRGGS